MTKNNSKVLVIVPIFNEASNINFIVEELSHLDYDIVFIDDSSNDESYSILRSLHLKVLPLPNNLGIGGCIQTGYKYAMYNNYDIAVQYDGDGQHIAKYIPDIVNKIEDGFDYVVGSRYIAKNEGFQSTKMRRLGIWMLSMIISILSGKRVYDVTSGFRGCNQRLIHAFCKYYPKDYPEPEVVGTLVKQGYQVAEVPVKMRSRQGGSTSIRPIKSIYYMLKVAFSIFVMSNSYSKED